MQRNCSVLMHFVITLGNEIHEQHRSDVVDCRAVHDPGISGHVVPEYPVGLLNSIGAFDASTSGNGLPMQDAAIEPIFS